MALAIFLGPPSKLSMPRDTARSKGVFLSNGTNNKESESMGRIGLAEVLVIFLIIVILFGAKRLPEIGQALGKALREFRKAGKDIDDDLKSSDAKGHEKKS
jgi:sec-independent protein translocase protein TatA